MFLNLYKPYRFPFKEWELKNESIHTKGVKLSRNRHCYTKSGKSSTSIQCSLGLGKSIGALNCEENSKPKDNV